MNKIKNYNNNKNDINNENKNINECNKMYHKRFNYAYFHSNNNNNSKEDNNTNEVNNKNIKSNTRYIRSQLQEDKIQKNGQQIFTQKMKWRI